MNRTAEVFADVAQFFGAEYQNDDNQYDNPVRQRKLPMMYPYKY